MKNILTVSSACILAYAGVASAQNVPAPAPIPATPLSPATKACEDSTETLKAEAQMMAYMKEMGDLCSTVKDKTSADAAAEKMSKLMEKQAAFAASQKSKNASNKISAANQAAFMTVGMKAAGEGMRVQQANYYGSQALKDAMEKIPAGAPAPTAK